MQKVIESAVIKITQAMEKNRKIYDETRENFIDTGNYRYQKKMDRLDVEYEELRSFLHPVEVVEVKPAELRKIKEMEQLLKNIKSKWFYIKIDLNLPATTDTVRMDDLLRGVD